MRNTPVIILFGLAVFLFGCGPVPLARFGSDSFDWDWGEGSAARAITDPSPAEDNLFIAFGIKAAQSGILVVGNSRVPDRTMDFSVQTVAKDGTTILGTLAKSETFGIADPSVINLDGLPAGTEVTPQFSLFMNRIGTDTRTSLHLSKQSIPYNPIQGHVDLVDEVVLRISNDSYLDGGGNWVHLDRGGYQLITQPHFIYTKDGETESYASMKDNLSVNGDLDYFDGLEYIAFVPSRIVGTDFYALVKGPIQDPTASGWKTNYAGNMTIFAMVDEIAGLVAPTNPQRAADPLWNQTADYLQRYLAKYYKSKCIMFGPTCDSSILFVAMNEALNVGVNEGIQVNVDFTGSTMAINAGVMTITGNPPFVFSTSILED